MPSPYVKNVFADTGNGYQNVGSNTHMSSLGGIMSRYGGGGGQQGGGGGYNRGLGAGADYVNNAGSGRSMTASMLTQGNGASGGGAFGTFRPSTMPGGAPLGGGGGGDINGLLARQQGENDWAKQHNEANWNMARDKLLGVGADYQNSATNNSTRGLVNNLLANPEAINDNVQSMIQNKAMNSIQSAGDNTLRRTQGIMAANGQGDAASMAAAAERIGRGTMAQGVSNQSNLEVQRANQRNGDIQNAIGAGQRMGQQDNNANMGVASTLIQNLPQYQAQDMSGYIAGLGGQGGGMPGGQFGGGGMPGGQFSGGGGGGPPGSFGGGFSGFQSMNGVGGGANAHGQSGSAGFGFSGMGQGAGNGMSGKPMYGNSGVSWDMRGVGASSPSGFGSSGQGNAKPYTSDPYSQKNSPYGMADLFGQDSQKYSGGVASLNNNPFLF